MNTKETLCPVCGEVHPYLIRNFDATLDKPVIDFLAGEIEGWTPSDGACTRCIDQAHIELQASCFTGTGDPGEVNGFKILPVPLRMMAETAHTGRRVTICIIDSGFHLHPDLIHPRNRVRKIFDITDPDKDQSYFSMPHRTSWHGTMTSVVCAGNGHLSGGIYRSIAPDADVVLIKVSDAQGAITTLQIVKALQWAVRNAKKYGIRIINLSITDDKRGSYQDSAVDQAVARAVEKGIVVVAASGNDPHAPVTSPANAPHALTVGGLNDRNTLNLLQNTLYHSTFGTTEDRIQKPDLIAPAIWLPVPILPGSPEQREAAVLFDLVNHDDVQLRSDLEQLISLTKLERSLLQTDPDNIRKAIRDRIGAAKYISAHYMHGDGTSFAAPLVCSVIAQMIEANPALDPMTIRAILLVTAQRIPGESADRQGWGLIQPAHAVQMAAGQHLSPMTGIMPVINYENQSVDFYLHQPHAKSVVLTGDFLHWSREGIPMETNGTPGVWKATFPFQQKGIYLYKYVIDQQKWVSDPRNLFREPDGFNDFNSKLIIQ